MKLYPVHLQLEGRAALVVGGGAVAAQKAVALHHSGAHVRVVAPAFTREMQDLIKSLHLSAELRKFVPEDLDRVWIAVAATDDPEVHRKISEEARQRKVLVCIVDDPAHSDFIVPAVLRRANLLVTVSTSGTAPALASRLRDFLGEILGEEYGEVLVQLQRVREQLKKRYPDFAERRKVWYELLDRKVLPALRRGEKPDLAEYDSETISSEVNE